MPYARLGRQHPTPNARTAQPAERKKLTTLLVTVPLGLPELLAVMLLELETDGEALLVTLDVCWDKGEGSQ
jgi:hypothetical protein